MMRDDAGSWRGTFAPAGATTTPTRGHGERAAAAGDPMSPGAFQRAADRIDQMTAGGRSGQTSRTLFEPESSNNVRLAGAAVPIGGPSPHQDGYPRGTKQHVAPSPGRQEGNYSGRLGSVEQQLHSTPAKEPVLGIEAASPSPSKFTTIRTSQGLVQLEASPPPPLTPPQPSALPPRRPASIFEPARRSDPERAEAELRELEVEMQADAEEHAALRRLQLDDWDLSAPSDADACLALPLVDDAMHSVNGSSGSLQNDIGLPEWKMSPDHQQYMAKEAERNARRIQETNALLSRKSDLERQLAAEQADVRQLEAEAAKLEGEYRENTTVAMTAILQSWWLDVGEAAKQADAKKLNAKLSWLKRAHYDLDNLRADLEAEQQDTDTLKKKVAVQQHFVDTHLRPRIAIHERVLMDTEAVHRSYEQAFRAINSGTLMPPGIESPRRRASTVRLTMSALSAKQQQPEIDDEAVGPVSELLHEAQLALEADHRKKEEFWAEHERLEQQIEAAKDAIDDAEQNITATRGVCRSLGGRLGLKIDERHLLDSRARQEALAAASSR